MRVANGIQHVRKHRENNNRGWQIWINDEYQGYSPFSLNELIESMDNKNTVIGIQGNVLSIRRSQ